MGVGSVRLTHSSKEDEYSCLCFAGDHCEHTRGGIKNTRPCICGSIMCTENTGLFCTNALSSCSPSPACIASLGSNLPNPDQCACGATLCSRSKRTTIRVDIGSSPLGGVKEVTVDGVKSLSCPTSVDKYNWAHDVGSGGKDEKDWDMCHDYNDTFEISVTQTKVKATRTDKSIGWAMLLSFDCTGIVDSGLYCYLPQQVCSDVRLNEWLSACRHQHGHYLNTESCACGFSECEANTYCTAERGLCSVPPACGPRDSDACNCDLDACNCGGGLCSSSSGKICRIIGGPDEEDAAVCVQYLLNLAPAPSQEISAPAPALPFPSQEISAPAPALPSPSPHSAEREHACDCKSQTSRKPNEKGEDTSQTSRKPNESAQLGAAVAVPNFIRCIGGVVAHAIPKPIGAADRFP